MDGPYHPFQLRDFTVCTCKHLQPIYRTQYFFTVLSTQHRPARAEVRKCFLGDGFTRGAIDSLCRGLRNRPTGSLSLSATQQVSTLANSSPAWSPPFLVSLTLQCGNGMRSASSKYAELEWANSRECPLLPFSCLRNRPNGESLIPILTRGGGRGLDMAVQEESKRLGTLNETCTAYLEKRERTFTVILEFLLLWKNRS